MTNLTMCILGCPELAAEISSAASANSDLNVLVIDIDILNPSMDLVLNVDKKCDKIKSYHDNIDNTGLNVAIDAYKKDILTKELLVSCLHQKKRNLYVMTDNYNMANYELYELYDPVSLAGIIEKARAAFDLIVLSGARYIYDDITYRGMTNSNIVVVPVAGDILSLRNANNEIGYLAEQKEIDAACVRYVVFEYNANTDLPTGLIRELSSGRLLGTVPYSLKRSVKRNKKAPYAMRLERNIFINYARMLSELGVPVKYKKAFTLYSLFKHIKKFLRFKKSRLKERRSL